jgi:2-aminoadipate transaminase
MRYSRAARAFKASAIRRAGDIGLRPDLISLAPGYPDPALFAWAECRDIAMAILTGADDSVLQYGQTQGYRPLLEALPDIVAARGIVCTADETIVTTGSQQALDLCARLFIDPGDVVLVELPSYTGGITAFGNAQARLVGVRQDANGIDLEDLDRVLLRERGEARQVAFLYVVPNFQNPTGLLMSLERRQRLLEWAARRDVLIVEDDPYGPLYFEDVAGDGHTRPVKADDRDGRVVYLSSFSKTVAPGFRVAWIVAPKPTIDKLEIAKQSADLCSSSLDQRIIFEIWRGGILTARMPTLRAHYREKRTAMEQALRRHLGRTATWSTPRGGFFLWASLPPGIDTGRLLPLALEHGMVYVPGEAFFVERTSARCLRLSFSEASPERIDKGIERFASAVTEALVVGHVSDPG